MSWSCRIRRLSSGRRPSRDALTSHDEGLFLCLRRMFSKFYVYVGFEKILFSIFYLYWAANRLVYVKFCVGYFAFIGLCVLMLWFVACYGC